MARAILRSVLNWLRAYTAQMVAGIQPMRVICKRRQINPATGRPMVKKVSQGRKNAIRRRKTNLHSSINLAPRILDSCGEIQAGENRRTAKDAMFSRV
jgi:hypothetical protein